MPATNVEHHTADLGEVTLHYAALGQGEPLVLIHGWPQTWYEWRAVMPALAERYRVIAPDLRGLGDSSLPESGVSATQAARDIEELVTRELGHESVRVVGHDWGGVVAVALAARMPGTVSRLAVLDVTVPGVGDFSQGGQRWHHFFHQVPDLPEALVDGRERTYLSWFFRTFAHRPDAIPESDIDVYVRAYSRPGAMRAGFEYYRAIPRVAAELGEIFETVRLEMPILAIGGTGGMGRGTEVGESLSRIAEHVESHLIDDCGHWVPEEQPEVLLRHLLPFLE